MQRDTRFYKQVDEEIDFKTRSLIAVPLAVKGKMIGVLEAVNKQGGETFTEEDVETLSVLADQAAVAIENAILFEQSDLVAEIVHEMRTPLTSIAGYAQMLQREGLGPEQRQSFAATIQREAMRLGQMATSFLELARLESGRTALVREQVVLHEVFGDVIEVLKPQADERSISLTLDVPQDLPVVTGDRARLKQTMINLVANAVKYSRHDDRVTITAWADEVTGGVIDTGPGIPPEAKERLFRKFYRNPAVEGRVEGSGLGLAISRQVVEAHGGRIWVESEVGKGTAFYFTLPVS